MTRTTSSAAIAAVLTLVATPVFGQCDVVETQKLTNPGGLPGDQAGREVAINGDVALVSAHNVDFIGTNNGGEVAVWERFAKGDGVPGAQWIRTGTLVAPDPQANHFFGTALALDGPWAVVGAYRDDDACSDKPGCDSGAVYLYYRSPLAGGSSYTYFGKLTASDAEPGDLFGISVAIDGDTLLVGAFRDDDACEGDPDCNSGSVYVFNHSTDGQVWFETTKLTASDAEAGGNFGWRLDVDGDTAVVIAGEVDGGGHGAAYMLERNAGGTNNWGEVQKLTSPDPQDEDYFGRSVDLSGDALIIGEFRDDYWCPGDPSCDAGMAHIFQRFSTPKGGVAAWEYTAELTAGDPESGDLFGYGVAIENGAAVVTALHDDTACPTDPSCNSGSAYMFVEADGWELRRKFTASDPDAGDSFGREVAMSDGHVIVGAHFDDEVDANAGAAYILELVESCACVGDINGNGSVDFNDILLVLEVWGPCDGTCERDLNGDGSVNFPDIQLLLETWGPCP